MVSLRKIESIHIEWYTIHMHRHSRSQERGVKGGGEWGHGHVVRREQAQNSSDCTYRIRASVRWWETMNRSAKGRGAKEGCREGVIQIAEQEPRNT